MEVFPKRARSVTKLVLDVTRYLEIRIKLEELQDYILKFISSVLPSHGPY